MATKIENITTGLDMLLEDSSVPRNIRRASEEIKALLLDTSEPQASEMVLGISRVLPSGAPAGQHVRQ